MVLNKNDQNLIQSTVCVCCQQPLLRMNDSVLLELRSASRLVSGAQAERRRLIGQRDHGSPDAVGWHNAADAVRDVAGGGRKDMQRVTVSIPQVLERN